MILRLYLKLYVNKLFGGVFLLTDIFWLLFLIVVVVLLIMVDRRKRKKNNSHFQEKSPHEKELEKQTEIEKERSRRNGPPSGGIM